MSEDVLACEGKHLDLAWRCLAAMRAQTETMPDMGVDELASVGLARMRARRLASLE